MPFKVIKQISVELDPRRPAVLEMLKLGPVFNAGHKTPLSAPLKKPTAGGGVTLFGLLMTSDLAGFPNTITLVGPGRNPWLLPTYYRDEVPRTHRAIGPTRLGTDPSVTAHGFG